MAAKKEAKKEAAPVEDKIAPRARLHKLTIQNFRAIGRQPVEIELDDIVVLVGANNTGKSSILRAYQLVMEVGAKGELPLEDFPGGVPPATDEDIPSIELETVLYPDSKPPAAKWIAVKENGDRHVRERWTWRQPGKPEKRGFNTELGEHGAYDPDHGPWGAAGVAQINRPEMHRIEPFDDPKKQADEIINLLVEATKQRVKDVSANADAGGDYKALLDTLTSLQKSVATDAMAAIEHVRKELAQSISNVFSGFTISLDARPEDDVARSISFFKTPPVLRMGPEDGHQTDLERQGSGTRRTLMWNALRIIADHKRTTKAGDKGAERPHILLLDEPELCLHPSAIRDACNVLYSLPKGGTWQVMVTTHSPAFIDLSRNNTSIIRVERNDKGAVSGTTIFRPEKAKLSEEDKERLKLLNMYDPYVAEFFFGGRTVIVEGDTEYTAFREVMIEFPDRFRDVHVVRARGKYTILSLCKILNHFGCPYAVLHDADTQKVNGKDGPRINSAWAANRQILDEIGRAAAPESVRLAASICNFEVAMFGGAVAGEKPYSAWLRVREDKAARGKVVQLLDYLVGNEDKCPDGVLPWKDEATLAAAVAAHEPQ